MRTLSFSHLLRPLLWALLPLLMVLSGCENDSDKAQKELEALIAQHKAEDDATIKAYLATNNITNYERRESGLYIIWQTRTTNGEPPQDKAQVQARYIGRRLTDDIRFDASIDNGTPCGCTSFIIGQVIEGWNEVLKLMRKGDRVIILVPSHLAYGATGSGASIPAFTPLKFDIQLVDFKNP